MPRIIRSYSSAKECLEQGIEFMGFNCTRCAPTTDAEGFMQITKSDKDSAAI